MKPAKRAKLWIKELSDVKDDKAVFWSKFDSIAGVLESEDDLESVTRTLMTIMRSSELKGLFEYGVTLKSESNFFKLFKGKFGAYVLNPNNVAPKLKPYTEEEINE